MRSFLVVVGASVGIIGYAVVYNGLSNIVSNPIAFPCGPVGFLDAIIPHRTLCAGNASATPPLGQGAGLGLGGLSIGGAGNTGVAPHAHKPGGGPVKHRGSH